MPGPMVSQAKQQLKTIIDAYLTESDVERVLAACDYADIAHDGITRKSGEPYILHPIAVSCILAHMRLDPETLMAALLHDVIEDTDFSKEDIAEKFGKPFPNWSMASPNLANPVIKNIIKPLLSEKFCKPHYKTHVSLLLNWLTAITT